MKKLCIAYTFVFFTLSAQLNAMQNYDNEKKIPDCNDANSELMPMNPIHAVLSDFLIHLQIIDHRTKNKFSLDEHDYNLINTATAFFKINKCNFFFPHLVSHPDLRLYNDFFEANVLFAEQLIKSIEKNNNNFSKEKIRDMTECVNILKKHVIFNKSIMQ